MAAREELARNTADEAFTHAAHTFATEELDIGDVWKRLRPKQRGEGELHALQWCLRRLQEVLAARARAGTIRGVLTKRTWRRARVLREVAPFIAGLLGDLAEVWAGVCPVDRIRSWVSWCQLRARELRQDMSRRSYKEWVARGSTAAKSGQRSAFQWLKRADAQDNDTCALGTFDQLSEQAGKWAEIWEARGGLNKEEIQHELDNTFGADLQALGRTPVQTTQNLTPAVWRKVVARFPCNTACRDGLPIWAVGLLSDGLLAALSRQIWCREISGRLPSTEMLTLSVLIPKPAGGVRPFGLLRSIARVWACLRKWNAGKWLRSRSDPRCNANGGRRVGDAMWRMQTRVQAGQD